MVIGYARVSTTDQNLDRQIEAFNKFGVEKTYSDKMSGKNFLRENYIKMLENLKSGDLLVVKSIDRLGRNYDMIIDEWRKITKEIGADIVVLDMPLLDTRDKEKGLTGKFISDLVLQILSYVAETERNNIKSRQAEGIRIAKEKGIHMGRPKYILPENFESVINDYINKKLSLEECLGLLNMGKSVFYKYAKLPPKPKKEKPIRTPKPPKPVKPPKPQRQPKPPKEPKLSIKQKIKRMLDNGISISEIMKELNIDYIKLKRCLGKEQAEQRLKELKGE